jgi:hypothetical protein
MTISKKNPVRRDYDWFRKHGYKYAQALAYARALEWAREHDLEIVTLPEQERYEDVFGEKPPPDTNFVTVALVRDEDNPRYFLQSVGMVEDDDDRIKEEGANLALEEMIQSKKRASSSPVRTIRRTIRAARRSFFGR